MHIFAAAQQLTDGNPQHAFSTTTVVTKWVKECNHLLSSACLMMMQLALHPKAEAHAQKNQGQDACGEGDYAAHG